VQGFVRTERAGEEAKKWRNRAQASVEHPCARAAIEEGFLTAFGMTGFVLWWQRRKASPLEGVSYRLGAGIRVSVTQEHRQECLCHNEGQARTICKRGGGVKFGGGRRKKRKEA
jgi:hypothetical protein